MCLFERIEKPHSIDRAEGAGNFAFWKSKNHTKPLVDTVFFFLKLYAITVDSFSTVIEKQHIFCKPESFALCAELYIYIHII